MPKTKTGLVRKTLKRIDAGALLAIDAPMRLDQGLREVAEDLFGEATSDVDVAIDDFVSAKPTGHRTWSSSEDWDEHYILD